MMKIAFINQPWTIAAPIRGGDSIGIWTCHQIPSELTKQINFIGPIDQEKLLKYYWDADILINPSLSEAFGMSLVEAMAVRVPVIGARVGGMAFVIDEGATGLLVEPANSSALAKATVDLLGDRDLRQKMGIEGNRRAKQLFSWDKITEDLLSLYQKDISSL